VAVCAINVFGTLCSGQALDRTGRKPLLLGSFVGMGASCLVIAYAMSVQATWALAVGSSLPGVSDELHGPHRLSSTEPCFGCKIT
jgi:MFS family permease